MPETNRGPGAGPWRAASKSTRGRRLAAVLALIVLIGASTLLSTCVYRPAGLTQVRRTDVLRVATVNSADTFYLGPHGPKGFEYDLAHGFAKSLGVQLKMVVVPNRAAVIRAVNSGRAQIGVGLAVSSRRDARVRFTPPYLSTPLEAVYRQHQDQPQQLSDLSGHLVLPDGTPLADWLRRRHPHLKFSVDHSANIEELMARIAHGDIDATIANADLVAMNQRYYPKLRVGFTLDEVRQRMAWAFAKNRGARIDDALYNKAIAYLRQAKAVGRIKILHNRYFGHAARLGFVGGAEFARQVDKRLDRWKADFKAAGKQYGVDWRLLAAIGYQESRWDAEATSPTNVRGIMMLTRDTAELMNVSDRLDPQQSIDGGTRYLLQVRERLPEAVKPPDRTWFALAAYNLGLGHVLDARRLLKKTGRDPNVWVNLRDALGWLSEKRYLDDTRYGYARGKQAAAYVSDIRAYYDILTWMTSDRHQRKPAALDEKPSADGAGQPGDENNAPPDISITSPAF
ncbi:membrane-bound lytic murein transglycosylase MltF [Salinisphaera sp.]|uniref:membrane-bound lytic murein transglycosylase MltF n=1 Tax=Salinisphaera sp. TaxID=1914330 RepID=UPI002D78A5B1|nr:membrane-bound lytic murein transglycosylase MltF [Salinisphaera sp.]HET7314267.1 membrane-bound lytic murein transglycosylase MltF [Salinisphaera sp.]